MNQFDGEQKHMHKQYDGMLLGTFHPIKLFSVQHAIDTWTINNLQGTEKKVQLSASQNTDPHQRMNGNII